MVGSTQDVDDESGRREGAKEAEKTGESGRRRRESAGSSATGVRPIRSCTGVVGRRMEVAGVVFCVDVRRAGEVPHRSSSSVPPFRGLPTGFVMVMVVETRNVLPTEGGGRCS